jgi:hypothetical protein
MPATPGMDSQVGCQHIGGQLKHRRDQEQHVEGALQTAARVARAYAQQVRHTMLGSTTHLRAMEIP